MDIDKLRDLIRILENSSLSEIEIEEGGHRIKLKKPSPELVASSHVVQAVPHTSDQQAPQLAHSGQESFESSGEEGGEDEDLVTVDSPMVGVFYSAPAPGDPPYVKPGDSVEANQTICIVEAMKLMNEVTAKFSGHIVKCLVENGEPVEFGQPLFAVRPLESV